MNDTRHSDLPAFLGDAASQCPLHPLRGGAWLCAACGRPHCDLCRNRTERRLTPAGTCLQCGGTLAAILGPTDAAGTAGAWAAWRQAYSRLGLLNAAALALPLLYGGFVVALIVPAILVTGFCVWVYFLTVVRWRLLGNIELPTPGRALQDVRSSMAVLGTQLAVLLAFLPAALLVTYGESPRLAILPALLAMLWTPVPILAGAASDNNLAPLVPIRASLAARNDSFGFLFMSGSVAALVVLLAVAASLIGLSLAPLAGVGLWVASVAVLPGLWALASMIGIWGRSRLADLDVDA